MTTASSPLTLEQRGRMTRAFADALSDELARFPRLTYERRDAMMRAVGAVVESAMRGDSSADDLIPHFAMIVALARYLPSGRCKTGRHGRPKRVSVLFPSKEQKRQAARAKRDAGEGKRGPRRGERALPKSYVDALGVMLDRIIRDPKCRKNTAAHGALRKVHEPTTGGNVKRLVRAWDCARYAADLPSYRWHSDVRSAWDTAKTTGAFSGETLSN
jgi:hypothetical protein